MTNPNQINQGGASNQERQGKQQNQQNKKGPRNQQQGQNPQSGQRGDNHTPDEPIGEVVYANRDPAKKKTGEF